PILLATYRSRPHTISSRDWSSDVCSCNLFLLTVRAVNDPPTISAIADQTTDEDTPIGPLTFNIGDVETAATDLTLSGSSSNPLLVPNSNIIFGGSDSNRTVTILPATNQFGTATITISVSDEIGRATSR